MKNASSTLTGLLLVAPMALVAVGCSAIHPSASQSYSMTEPTQGAPVAQPDKYAYAFDYDNDNGYAAPGLQTSRYDVDAQLVAKCERVEPSLYFPTASAKVDGRTQNQLELIARCLKGSDMAHEEIIIIGHADSRGDDGYNDVLGRDRALAVAAALQDHGLEAARMSIDSEGEEQADAPDLDDDRRVVIRLR